MITYSLRRPNFKPPPGACVNFGHTLGYGLCGLWLINERGGTTLYDLAGYSNGAFGAAGAAPTWENGGNSLGGNIALASASNQKVTITNNAQYLNGSFSISLLANVTALPNNSCVISKVNGNSGPFQIHMGSPTGQGNIIQFFLGSDSGFAACMRVDGPTILVATWYYFTFVFDYNGGGSNTATGRIYVNGIQQATNTGTASNYGNDSKPILLGARDDSGVPFGGKIGLVKIWNRLLSPSEVLDDYINPFAVIDAGRAVFTAIATTTPINVTVSDSMTMAELFQYNVGISLTVVDVIAMIDAFGPTAGGLNESFNDFMVFIDTIQMESDLFMNFSDSMTMLDIIQILLGSSGIVLSDSLVMTDTLAIQINGNIQIVLTDTLNMSDAIATRLSDTFTSYIRRYLNDVQN